MPKPIGAMIAGLLGVALCAPMPPQANAAVTVLGEGFANRCFRVARVAVRIKSGLDESLKICNNALEFDFLNPRDRAATLVNRGILLLAKLAYADARQDFDKAISLAPDLAEAYVDRGAALLGLHLFAEALVDLDRGIAMNSDELEKAYYNRGLARERLNDAKGAYYDYLKASELMPDWDAPKRELQRFTVTKRNKP